MSSIVLNYGWKPRFNFKWWFGSKTTFHGQRGRTWLDVDFCHSLKNPAHRLTAYGTQSKRLAAPQL